MQKMKAALKMEIQRDEDEEAAKKQKELEEQGCSVWKLTLLTKFLSQLNELRWGHWTDSNIR